MKKIFLLLFILCFALKAYSSEYFDYGIAFFNQKNYIKAQEYFRAELQLEPNNVDARYYYAHCLYNLKYDKEAIKQYETVIRIAPESQAGEYSKTCLEKIKPLQIEKSDNYFDALNHKNGKIPKWDKKLIAFYVVENPNQKLVIDAFNKWQSLLGGLFKFYRVYDKKKADITIAFVNELPANEIHFQTGLTNTKSIDNVITASEINILDKKYWNKKQLEKASIYSTSAHEIGHSLGINGHSNSKTDLMYPVGSGIFEPSKRDVNTLKMIYRQN